MPKVSTNIMNIKRLLTFNIFNLFQGVINYFDMIFACFTKLFLALFLNLVVVELSFALTSRKMKSLGSVKENMELLLPFHKLSILKKRY